MKIATKKVKSVEGFIYTTAIKKLRKLKKRVKVVPGGTSAGKTFGILPILIDKAIKTPNLEISVVSESIPHLRKGALKDFLKILKATGRYNDKNYNRTLLTYTFTNGSYIEFFSADQEDKVRGPRRHILYVNECNNLTFETYHQLSIRTSLDIWLDFNPSNEFWAHKELREDEDAEWLTLTYKDNEALDSSIVKEIEKARSKAYVDPNGDLQDPENVLDPYWVNWWKVYGLGQTGKLEGVIFNNWKTIKQIPTNAKLLGYGMDFGYTNSYTALVAVYGWKGTIIVDELIYAQGLKNKDIAKKLKELGVSKKDLIIADSNEPKSIAEIREYGFNMRPANKGPGSVTFGIDLLQQDDFYVTERSVNLIEELRVYCWAKDKFGNALNEPVKAFDHAIDALRYLATRAIAKARSRKTGVRRRN